MINLIRPVYAEDSIIPTYEETGFKYRNSFFTVEYTLGNILSDLLTYVYIIAGLILLILLIFGGFSLMTSGGNPDKMKLGYGKIKTALIGFLIIFVSYMVVLLVQAILGIDIGFGPADSLF